MFVCLFVFLYFFIFLLRFMNKNIHITISCLQPNDTDKKNKKNLT